MIIINSIKRMYKSIFAFVIVIVIALKPLYSYSEKMATLKVAGDKNFPPYEFIDEDGEYKGFNVDLMRALALEMKVDIKFMPMDWLAAHAALINGEVDLIQGMNFNKQRQEIYDFSTPYILNSSVVFMRVSDPNKLNLSDLKGKIVAVQRSDFTAYILAEQGEIEVKFVSDLVEGFTDLLQGKVDAVFSNKLTGMNILNKHNFKDSIKIVGDEINQMDYGIAVKKGNSKLISEVNEALTNLKKNGTYIKIYEKWFGSVEDKNKQEKIFIYTLLSLIFLSMIFFYFSLRWNKRLKDEVGKRTWELHLANEELILNRNIINESDKFKEQIIDSLSIGLITFNKVGCVTALNNKGVKIFSINKEEAIGRTFTQLGLDKFFDIKHINDCIELEKSVQVEETIFNINGHKYYYNYLISPLKANQNRNNGGVITFRDITDEKRIRLELEQQSKMKSLGRMVAGIAHEIRNPLTSIKTYLEVLPDKYDNPKFRQKITKQVPMEINRLNTLLKELLDYAKPKSSIVESFSISELIYEVIDLLNTFFENKNICFRTKVDTNLFIDEDKNKLKQILINILLNSIEAIDNTGTIEIKALEDENYIQIEIEDNGVGIDENSIDKIFEPFYTTKDSGTGLGLALCYQYLKDKEGDIKILSNKGEGTLITVYLRKEKGDIQWAEY